MNHAVKLNDIVKVIVGKVNIFVHVEVIKSAANRYLLEGEDLSNATRLMPDLGPNAVNDILLCGKVYIDDGSKKQLNISDFESSEICVKYNDIVAVLNQRS